jgi:uncharacterized protein YkwD
MGSIDITSKSGKIFSPPFDKTLCRKTSCLSKSKVKCRYCGLSFCKEHRAPLPDKNRKDFGGKGHSCDKLPANKTIKDIVKKYPELRESKPTTKGPETPPIVINPPTPPTPSICSNWILPVSFLIFAAILILSVIVIVHTAPQADNYQFRIFESVNALRESHNQSYLDYDYNAYRFAVFVSNKSYENNVSGNYSKYASEFKLANITIIRGYLKDSTNVSIATLLKQWTSDAVDRSAILKLTNRGGAVGCFRNICTLVLVKTEKVGFWSKFNFFNQSSLNSYASQNSPSSQISNKPKNPVDSSSNDNDDGFLSNVKSFVSGPTIDNSWVHNFMSIVNQERAKKGLPAMQELTQLDSIATTRFNTMMQQPSISHYGAEGELPGGSGEVVFYPDGFAEQDYIDNLQQSAPLHWDLLMHPMFSAYGYHIEKGSSLGIVGFCPTTEIPGPNIDARQFFSQMGCQTTTITSTWLVIDMG